MPHSLSDQRGDSQDAEPLLDEEESYGLHPLHQRNGPNADTQPRSPRSSQYRDDAFLRTRGKQHREHTITPLFYRLQIAPIDLINRLAPTSTRKTLTFAVAFGLWLLLFSLFVLRRSSVASIGDYGPPKRLSCTSAPWPNEQNNNCGINGAKCLPFANESLAFRCPPDCASVKVLEPSFVGDQPVQYNPWVIGGPMGAGNTDDDVIYRGDSWICSAAIHSGVIDHALGGCGVLSLVGEKSAFSGAARNGIKSIKFDSSFPMAFTIQKLDEPSSQCHDLRWATLFISVFLTICISIFTTSPQIFYFTTFTVGFFQVALVSDMPDFEEYLLVVQYALSRFLPSMFVAVAIYRFCAAKTLTGLGAQFEKTILWLGGFWFGALENYTLDKLPLSRLTPRDFAQPGAWLVFIVVVAIIALAALGQAWAFWQDGRFYRYLAVYGGLVFSLVLLALLPGLNLRIHHYILALLLLPGTAIQTRPSLLFQGFLVGLFINGVARWGFASILETNNFLAGKGPLGSNLPEILAPVINGTNITFTSASIPKAWDGLSMKVNDVERFRWAKGQGIPTFSWTRIKDEPLYFRFGYFRMAFIDGLLQGDYTSPGTWVTNGTWSQQNMTGK